MVPATAAPHCLLLRAHSRPLPPSHAPMPAGDPEDPDTPAAGAGAWLRLGLTTPSQEDAAPEGSIEFDLFAPAGRAPPPAMDLFPTHPASGAAPRCGPHRAGLPASGELRVVAVPPPARPPVGLWFALRAAQSLGKEPSLPQLRKSYLRIKDGRMTVRLLMKYLVCKLGLRHESEVEITCRGQQLPPFHTLQYVRDSIWCSRDLVTMLPIYPSEHVMILQYGRRT